MGWRAAQREIEAAERRQQREAQKTLRELERRAKEQSKLSIIEQARLEVDTYENKLELLLSIHKEQGENWDWMALFTALPPPYPTKTSYHELKAKQRKAVLPPHEADNSDAPIEQARLQDERAFQEAVHAYFSEKTEWEKLKALSHRILAGEHKAYKEALAEFNPFAEISGLLPRV